MATSKTAINKIVAETQNLNYENWGQCSIGKKVKSRKWLPHGSSSIAEEWSDNEIDLQPISVLRHRASLLEEAAVENTSTSKGLQTTSIWVFFLFLKFFYVYIFSVFKKYSLYFFPFFSLFSYFL